jgi:hypothetical protein
VLRYQLDGTFVDEFTSVGVSQSIGLDWDSQGNLYVSSFDERRVRKFDSDGNDLGIFVDTNLLGPTNVQFENNGDLLVLDWSSSGVRRYDSDGSFISNFIGGLSQAEGIENLENGIKDFIPSGFGGLATPVAVVRRDLSGFEINPGLTDAWYDPATSGQGFLITVFPNLGQLFVAWFTYDTERPPEDVTAMLGEPGHRWLTAQGPYEGNTANLTINLTEGGVFDAAEPPAITDLDGYGSMTVEFTDCSSGLVQYEISSLSISGEIPIERIALDNVALCESLSAP